MAFTADGWNQVKSVTADELISALVADGYKKDPASSDATISYIKYAHPTSKRIVIHYHPRKTYGPKLLRALLNDAGWNDDSDLARVGLIKLKSQVATAFVTVPCACDGGLSPAGDPCPECGGTRFREIPTA